MAVRGTPTTITDPSGKGEKDYATDVNEEVTEVWKKIANWLGGVAGTNTITATSTPTLDAYFQPMAFWLVPVADNTGAVTINIDAKGVKSVLDTAGVALVADALLTGVLYLLIYDGTNFRVFSGVAIPTVVSPAPDMLVQDEQTSDVDGGTFTLGAWRTRVLNTVVRNVITGASLATNQITLPAGDYYIEWQAPANRVNGHQSRLQNITDVATEESGTSSFSAAGTTMNINSFGHAVISISSAKDFEIQHQSEATQATTGFGNASGAFSAKEIYTVVKIWKE